MKKLVILSLLLVSMNSYSNNDKEIQDLKTFALSTCVQENYKRINPDFIVDDVTNSFITPDKYPLSLERSESFLQFINHQTSDFYKKLPYEGYELPHANLTFYKCMDFYHSEELSLFIQRLLKKDN